MPTPLALFRMAVVTALLVAHAHGETPPPLDASDPAASRKALEQKYLELEARVTQLEGEVALLNEQSSDLIRRTVVGFQNATYLTAGMAMLFPRKANFVYPPGTGIGIFAGVGHYLGRSHVLEATVDYDLYPSLSLRYRYEFHGVLARPLSLSPVIGAKLRLANAVPIDDFVDRRQPLDSHYWIVGIATGISEGRARVCLETAAWINRQVVLAVDVGLQVFL